jgi:signal transduction histidine kinase
MNSSGAGTSARRRRRTRRAVRLGGRAIASVLAALVVLGMSLVAVMLVTGDGVDGWTAVIAIACATTIGAVSWPRARHLIGVSIDRAVRGAPRTPEDIMRALQQSDGLHHDDTDDGARRAATEELLVQLAESLLRTFEAADVAIWRPGTGDEVLRVVSVPHREERLVDLTPAAHRVLASGGVVGRAWAEMWWPDLLSDVESGEVRLAPATHAGQLLAVAVLTRPADADRFSPAEDAQLGEIADRLGIVLHNRELDAALQDSLHDLRRANAELRASRVRLVATADAERRRLERDLHDGAQQHLVALAVDLRLAADEIAADPSVARERLSALGNDVKEAIAELRSLAHGIYPPLLMDQGLVEALRVSARRSPSAVSVSARDVGRYPPEIEAAAYFCCMEALQNAAKHAPGARVRVDVTGADGGLTVVVEDDGPGFDPATVDNGHGLGNMRDRIGAAGGALTLERAGTGGARVVVEFPVHGP